MPRAGEDIPLEAPADKYTLIDLEGNEKNFSEDVEGKGQDGKTKLVKYTNGDEYADGEFKEGKRHGDGTYRYRVVKIKDDDGEKGGYNIFKGKFEDNKKTGLGRMTYHAGGYYHGHYLDGKRHGEGTFKYPNGDIYSGMWKEGKRSGKGTYVFAGTKYEMKGIWKNGQIQNGTWSFTDGTRYVGGFRNQKPCGDGQWQTAKGTIIEGAYVQQVVPLDEDTPGQKAKSGEPMPTATRTFWNTATMVGAED